MEYLDVVDKNNNLTGEIVERECAHRNGVWHREVAIWIVNEQDDVLLQKRSANKKQEPNMWAICAGHIDAGETVEVSVVRELEEELGFKVTIDDLELMWIEKKYNEFPNGRKNYNFQYMYFLKVNWKIEDYKIQLDELSEVKYITFNEFEKIIETKDPNVTFSRQNYTARLLKELKNRM